MSSVLTAADQTRSGLRSLSRVDSASRLPTATDTTENYVSAKAEHAITSLQRSTLTEGEVMVRKKFTDAEMLDFLQRHHTLHKKVDFLYVVDGYEAVVTWDDEPLSPVFKGLTLREALEEMMQGGDILTSTGR